MKTSYIYIARVVSIEKVPTIRENIFRQIIRVVPINSVSNNESQIVNPPSFMPFTITGGGVTSIPQEGALCVVLKRSDDSLIDQILTYMPYDSVGPEGIFNPEEPDPNAVVLKVGGEDKAALTLAPGGKVGLYSSPQAFFKVDGSIRTIESNIDNLHFNWPAGFETIDYAEEHPTTGIADVTEYKMLFSKTSELRQVADWDLGLENTNKLAAAFPYNDKVIIRAGTIYNYDASILVNKEKTEIGHVYQIETRQNTLSSNEKDTVTVLRIGYQEKNNLKYTEDTKYPAGTMLEWATKRVNNKPVVGGYSSYLMRYGKLESDTLGSESEKTKGEIYRLQIYDNVCDPIAMPVVNPIGIGKGWKYENINLKATEQFTESFGLLDLDESFYRKHIHAYPDLTKATLSTYNGYDYTNVLGGDNFNYTEYTEWELAKKKNSFITTLKNDLYTCINTQFVEGSEKTYESIKIGKDNFEIIVKASETCTYNLIITGGNILIQVDTGDQKSTSIRLNNEGKIEINPGTSKAADGIYLGGNSVGQQLVTRAWLEKVFANHIHNTTGPGAPTLPPIPIPIISASVATSHTTFITKIE